ncbi:HEAT repeat-containing protein 7A, partial [Ophiophagus hannah]
MTLMDAAGDKDPLVQEQIFSALCALGRAEPEEVLNACEEHLRQHEKLAHPPRVIVLRAMEAVVKSSLAQLDKSTAKIVIFLASSEMTKSKQAASTVLVAVGRRFINQVMEEMLTKFQPGVLPHGFVVLTFANLSVTNEPVPDPGSLGQYREPDSGHAAGRPPWDPPPPAASFPDRLLGFLLPKLESSNEKTRLGTLTVLRQIINSTRKWGRGS